MTRDAQDWRPERVLAGLVLAAACPACNPHEAAGLQPLSYEDFEFAEGTPDAEACVFDGDDDPSKLVVTTTDFSTGAVSIVDVASRSADVDVAIGSPDAIPVSSGGQIAIVHRHLFDFIDLLSAETWRSRVQLALEAPDAASPNPHGLAFGPDGSAYIPLFGSRYLLKTRLEYGATPSFIDMGIFADRDERPEASIAFRCGTAVWIVIQRYDWKGAYRDALVAIDTRSDLPYDLDGEGPDGTGIDLLGTWAKQVRADPTDPRGGRLLVLTTGVEQVDLREQESEWLLSPGDFEQVGITIPEQPLAFDIDANLTHAYVLAYVPPDAAASKCEDDWGLCFEQATIFDFALTGDRSVSVVENGLHALAPSLEVVGDELWVATRTIAAPGLLVFSLRSTPPSRVAGPINVGLPPYAITTL